jgi:hypothetical protein
VDSLIDPHKIRVNLFQTDYQTVAPLLSAVLKAEHATEETRERVIAATGMVKAATLLAGKYTLVTTNVPYLGRVKQTEVLADYCGEHYSEAKADLATCFVDRCLHFCQKGGSTALVTPQSWLFLTSYRKLRERLLKLEQWDLVARLGPRAFETISGEVVNVVLVSMTHRKPASDHSFKGWDVGDVLTPSQKAEGLGKEPASVPQWGQLSEVGSRISLDARSKHTRLSKYASSHLGICTGDYPRFGRLYWELPIVDRSWSWQQSSIEDTTLIGGLSSVILWQDGRGELYKYLCERLGENGTYAWLRGEEAWGRRGVLITATGALPATLYFGHLFDNNVTVITVDEVEHLPALWAFCESGALGREVRRYNQQLKITDQSFVEAPFDLAHWQTVAAKNYPNGIPKAHSTNPTQWLFNGHPRGADDPLQVAVSRLVGYQWPRQTGASFPESPAVGPDGLESLAAENGIVPLGSIAGEASAGDRLRILLASAYGEEWSAAKLAELLGDNASLESWLRDRFFEEHCQLFQQHPVVWHVWDGRKDGFNALVNCHKLAAPNGEGRKTLEKLIYTTLGDWITRQRADVAAGVDGADGRLAAAEHLKGQLEKILQGESPYDIFVRWKPLDQQPIGWEPDINDGVRMNIRPWLTATTHQSGRRDGCILRVTPKIKYGKDRGKEPLREKEDFPWFWTWDEKTDDFAGGVEFNGARWNDPHYSLNTKQKARDRKMQLERA